MTRAEIRTFIESGFEALSQNMPFGSGRITEFNSERSREYPHGWLESLSTGTDIFVTQSNIDNWNIVIHIAKKDKPDSIETDYEPIIDDCDLIAQELIKKYNAVVNNSKLITMSGVTREPFIKQHADCLTGVIMSFTLTAPDKTSFC